ncbi:hypothetical protein ZM66_002414 [Salmonella enterica subsp. enterica]|nr:hypothetical protein [Salmonella enterica subsp. enterica]
MGINAGIKFFNPVIHHKSPALTTFIRCLQGTPFLRYPYPSFPPITKIPDITVT